MKNQLDFFVRSLVKYSLNRSLKLAKPLLIFMLSFTFTLESKAILMSELNQDDFKLMLNANKVGVFIGTFDPLHKSHEDIVSFLLNSQALDFVFIGANDKITHKPNALPWDLRNEFLVRAYKSHPKVIVTNDISFSVPVPANNVAFLLRLMNPTMVYGIFGTDVASIPDIEDQAPRIIRENGGRVDAWLVNNSRPELIKNEIPSSISFKPLHLFTSDGQSSSSLIRKTIASEGLTPALDSELSPEVIEVIKEYKIYGLSKSCTNYLN